MKLLIVASLAVLARADGSTQPTSYQQPTTSGKQFQILSQENVHPGDGNYRFSFQTENGIERDETKAGYGQQGGWSYTDDYGNAVRLTFTADEYGYQPASDVLPTPVPTEYPVPVVPQVYQGEQSYGQAPAPPPARYSPARAPAPVPARYSPAPAPAPARYSPAPTQTRYSPAPSSHSPAPTSARNKPAPVPAPARHNPAPAPDHTRYNPAPAPTPAPARYSPAPAPAQARYNPAPAPTPAPSRHSPAPTHARNKPAPAPAPARYNPAPVPAPQRYN